jgi:hypothetical protein
MTRAQAEALAEGGLSRWCLDNHPDDVCIHCGCCRSCMSGCGCDDPRGEAEEPCYCGGCDEQVEEGGQ